MINRTRKGTTNRLKTQRWLEARGWKVQCVELKTRYRTQDLFGADLFGIKDDRAMAVQVKSNRGSVQAGIRDLEIWGPTPVEAYVALWEPYAREPKIWDAKTKETLAP